MSNHLTCPNGCDLRGPEIPEESLRTGSYGKWDGVEKRYFSRVFGYEDPYKYDGVWHYICPDCGVKYGGREAVLEALSDGSYMRLEHSDESMGCHAKSRCKGEYCTLHNRSDHAMRSFRQQWRADRQLMERICSHGVGHPDPDEIDLEVDAKGVHGCDGCC